MEYQGQHAQATNRVDEYGNPVAGHGTAAGGMGTHDGVGTGAAAGGHKTGGILHRSNSSSSSSSEDDGVGGRRKKGIKDKIKEKLPGGQKDDQQHNMANGGTYGQQGHTGMAGTGLHDTTYGQQGHTGVTGTGGHTGPVTGTGGHSGVTGTGAHGTGGTGEKKGIMDKIKEKLPGQH